MPDDYGIAIATGDFVGPTAEAIVIVGSGTQVTKWVRAPHDWGEFFAIIDGPW